MIRKSSSVVSDLHHHYTNTKRRIKKLIQSERRSVCTSCLQSTTLRHSNSVDSLHSTTKAIAAHLHDSLTDLLKAEDIDSTKEPDADARSQSQTRNYSAPSTALVASETLVSNTMYFCKDVKKRFSHNNPSLCHNNDGTEENFVKDLLSLAAVSSSLQEPLEPITRLRRYASDESLPSDSGCGSSVKTGSLSTDSNRSSICTIEDVNSSGVLFRGPFIGQARAVIDCTPCPYDKDALAFKKGDIVNIIAKNDSGTWIGMANGKIGHFKFISVEESQNVSKLARYSYRIRPKGATIGSNGSSPLSNSVVVSTTVSVDLNSGADVGKADFEQILNMVKCLISKSPDVSIEKLFELLDLKESDYSKIFSANGFETLKSLKSLENQSTLKSYGVTNMRHQNLILYIAKMVRESIERVEDVAEDEEQDERDEFRCENFNCTSSRNKEKLRQDHKFAQSAPTTPAVEYSRDSLSDWFHNVCLLSREQKERTRTAGGEHKERGIQIASSRNNEYLCGQLDGSGGEEGLKVEHVRGYSENRDDPGGEVKQFKQKNSHFVNDTGGLVGSQEEAQEERSSSSSIVNHSLVQNLQHGFNKKALQRPSTTKSKPNITSSKSVLDLRVSSRNTGLIQGSHQHYTNTKRRIKRFLQSDRKSVQSSSSLETSTHSHYNSINSLHTTSKPISAQLLDSLTHLLRAENIDLTREPYSDASGFCGIPPPLVQRYAEELEQDLYDVADAIDHIRLGSLMLKGKSGIPNDFLGDSCTGPIVEQASYESLNSWLISIGLPMYRSVFRQKGFSKLSEVASVRENELLSFGITKPSHRRSLSNAICALNIYVHTEGKV